MKPYQLLLSIVFLGSNLSLGLSQNAWALESDENTATQIDADKMTYSEKDNLNVFEGNVRLSRGSLIIRGQKLSLSQKPDGTQHAMVEGTPATFNKQREAENNEELFIIGQANRIKFNGETQVISLEGAASIQKTTNGEVTEQISGTAIVYDQKTEFLSVGAGTSPDSKPSRVQAIIKPSTPR